MSKSPWTRPPERDLTIELTATGEDGAGADDYTVPVEVTFGKEDTVKAITFEAASDSDNDDGESVRLGFKTPLPDGVTAGTGHETVVSITDDDVPDVTVNFKSAAYTAAEGGTVDVEVTLDAAPERDLTIELTATGEDGAGADDYTVPVEVTFGKEDTVKAITFEAASDSDNDDGESVRLGFKTPLPPGVTAGTGHETVVSITDDDVPDVTVNFKSAAYTATEGGTVDVEVTLDAAPERDLTIKLTATGEDGAGADDYTVPVEVTFGKEDTVKAITFEAASDSDNDDGESVRLGFKTPLPDGVTAGTDHETVVSITDDDVPDVTVNFKSAAYTAAEGGTVDVEVTLDAAPERDLTIELTATGEDGAGAGDYTVPVEVTFGKEDTVKAITFEAASDSDNDDGESVRLGFKTPLPDGVTAGTDHETVVSITDDDVPQVTVNFGSPTYSVTEGEAEGVEVTVTLSEDPEQTVIIPITRVNQDGASDSDYTGVPENVTFNRGEMVRSFIVEAVRDNLEDSGESVKLGFGTLSITVTEGTTDEATVTIANVAAQTSLTINFGAAMYSLTEGEEATVTVTLNTAPGSDATIPLIKTDRGGATDDDYTVVKKVTFESDDTTKTMTFIAKDDDVDDDGESVKLEFGDLPGGVSAGTVKETVVSIVDDDEPGVEVSFDQATYSATEGGANAEIMVRLSAPAPHPVDIPLTAEGHYKATPDDWTGVPEVLTFNTGDTWKSFTLVAFDDTVKDDGEMVELGFGTLPDGFVAGSPATARVTLMNDDRVQTEPSGEAGLFWPLW